MIVVSDTSPISALLRIGQLHLLAPLYGKVIIPTAVHQELSELVNWGYDPQEIFAQPWVEIRQCPHNDDYQRLRLELDEGEVEAIVLAKTVHADLLLIDELKGRKIAKIEGLKIIGVLGVLLDAKEAGMIAAIKPLVENLVLKANFRLDENLFQKVLLLAKEFSED